MNEKLLLLGDEAIALGAINAGLTGVYAYPGTPSTEITEYIQHHPLARERGLHSRWCANEKTALEAALGVSYIGKRALVCMKHVGMNVAADAFVNAAMTGVNGGLVVVAADDPSMHSSQNEQDSRFYGKFAFVPILEPSSQQEAYDMTSEAFDLSERLGVPVMMRITTRMAHSRAIVSVGAASEQTPMRMPSSPADWILLPVNARRRYLSLLETYDRAAEYASSRNLCVDGPDRSTGIIACGIGYNYVMEHFTDDACRDAPQPRFSGAMPHPLLRITHYPLPVEAIRRMAAECGRLLVVEDGQPFVEEQVRGVLPSAAVVAGRLSGELPRVGELTPDNVRAALGLGPLQGAGPCPLVVPRPPALCAGCGHRDLYNVLNEELRNYPEAKVFSDIGCYTLGALPPFRAIDSCVDMGASITMAKGAADGGLHPSIAVIGDSTFTHSGMTGLLDAVNSNSPITVVISDNLTTAMTGGQDSAGTGRLEAICQGLGVDPAHICVVVPLPANMGQIREILRRELDHQGVSVIIPRRECIQTLKRKL
ncbi:MAG: indolepyruvate ferredoxin oxidoreductase subunit alpha [Rikenellaceae bacterium]|nr:indolepyruvate ferredoxin oxidoreductase subunit alpha [Rikenellaceae bacterium]